MADNNLTPLSYEQVRAMEQAGTGFASHDQPPWPVQQAANTAAMNQAAAAAAATDKALKTRHAWSPAKNPYIKKGK